MAWTSVGFDGTINEAQWSALAGLLGNGYVAAGNGDCVVTAVPGARSVSVAAGSLYGDGVLSTNSGPETVAMTTPVNGQWYVIALRRTWATNTAALVAIAGATTTTTTPTAPPTSFPTLNTNVGVLTDQPIALAWCNSANTTVVVYDIRLKAVKSLPPVVANANERDAKFMTPTQGLQVWRDDLGAVETYFGLYNASTNPGGRDAAGWYVNDRQTGLIPIQPTSVAIASGTGSAKAIGRISFSNATAVNINGVFSTKYRSYKIVFSHVYMNTPGQQVYVRYRKNGTDTTSAVYATHGFQQTGTNAPIAYQAMGAAVITLGQFAFDGSFEFDTHNAAYNARTSFQCHALGWTSNNSAIITSGMADDFIEYDGISFIPQGGSFNGEITIFGYNY